MFAPSARPPFKVALVIGTRPEAIKLAPVLAQLRQRALSFEPIVITTGQHTDMLAAALESFGITPDIELEFTRSSLADFAEQCRPALAQVFRVARPDVVIVQGDTTSALIGAMVAHAQGIPVAHVEAGLRSGNRMAPFPEEDNRCAIASLADLHFAPTPRARENLLREGVSRWSVSLTGNTVVDALRSWELDDAFESSFLQSFRFERKTVLVTAHRRESHEAGISDICRAIRELAATHEELEFVFPVHRNPRVSDVVHAELGGEDRVHLIEPLSYPDLLRLMQRSWLVLTDSGGMQEEAPSFGTPLLILRETTERQEVVEAGGATLVGTCRDRIVAAVNELLQDADAHARMSAAENPFGDGFAAVRITRRLKLFLEARRTAERAARIAAAAPAGWQATDDVPTAAFVA
jgi:UDP-N-acetylglucosamine 2-epimerase